MTGVDRDAEARRAAELEQSTTAALAGLAGRVLRTARVVRVLPTGADDGRPLLVLDWADDPDDPVEVPARCNRDTPWTAGDTAFVVVVGRTAFALCRVGGSVPLTAEES